MLPAPLIIAAQLSLQLHSSPRPLTIQSWPALCESARAWFCSLFH